MVGYSNELIAAKLNTDKFTVHRTMQMYATTGTVAKLPYPKERATKKLTDPPELFILNIVVERPGITLREIQEDLLYTLLIEVDVSNICRLLQQSGFTRQRLQISALQVLRQCYMEEVSIYNPGMFIFQMRLVQIGEIPLENMVTVYVSSKPLVNHQLLFRGCQLSGLAFISVNGLLDVRIVQETTNGETFYSFIEECLLPQLMPFNGSNPYSVVIMDNCSICEIAQIIEEVGAIVHFYHLTHLSLCQLK